MNRIFTIVMALIAITCADNLYAQKNYKGSIYYRSSNLREVNDKLNVEFDIEILGKAINRGEGLRLTPTILAEENATALPDILICGSNKKNVYSRWRRLMSRNEKQNVVEPTRIVSVDPDGKEEIKYMVKIPFQDWMDNARMVLYVENLKYANRNYLLAISMADRVELAPRVPYQVNPLVNYITPAAEQKKRSKQGQALLDFQAGRSVIIPTYRRNPEELEKIRAAFNEIMTNPDVKINGLFIEGYASPEGNYKSNDRLSRERTMALMNYITNNFNIPISTGQIRTSSVAEDWDGLRAAVENSNIASKSKILSIIDNTPDFDQREARLKHLGYVYQVLLKDFFPELRRVEYQIDFSVKDYTLEETKQLIDKNSLLLSQKELYQAAMSYPKNSTEYERIMLDEIPRLFPNDATANINAAATMIARGEYATAKRYLEKFANEPTAWNNLGVIALFEGDLENAQRLLQKASINGVKEADHNLAELQKKRDDNARMARYNK